MALVMKETISKGKNAASVNSNGLMAVNTLEISTIIIYTVKVLTLGAINEYTKENGKIIKWMEKENSFGLMVEHTMEAIKMIKKKVMEFSSGRNN